MGSPSRMESYTVAISEMEKAILDRLDDGRAMLVPLVNDRELRKWLNSREVRDMLAALAKLARVRLELGARFNR